MDPQHGIEVMNSAMFEYMALSGVLMVVLAIFVLVAGDFIRRKRKKAKAVRAGVSFIALGVLIWLVGAICAIDYTASTVNHINKAYDINLPVDIDTLPADEGDRASKRVIVNVPDNENRIHDRILLVRQSDVITVWFEGEERSERYSLMRQGPVKEDVEAD